MSLVTRTTLATAVRLGMALLALLLAVGNGSAPRALPWILLVIGMDLAATWRIARSTSSGARADTLGLIAAAAAAAGIAYAVDHPAMASLAFVPAYHGGLVFGRRALGFAVGTSAVFEVLTLGVVDGGRIGSHSELAWLLGCIVFALLGALSYRLSGADEDLPQRSAREASMLLGRLQEIAGEVETGFDAPAIATSLLDAVARSVTTDRAVLLVGSAERPIPIGLTGTNRMPWESLHALGSPLVSAWDTGEPVTSTVTTGDGHRAVLGVPVLGADGQVIGLVGADRAAPAFTAAELATVSGEVASSGPLLEAALLFARLRERAALEERSRLAREMHDGVAQELAALAYVADAARLAVANGRPDATDRLDDLRTAIRATVTDMRTRIADLRMVERPDRSLGTILGSAVQALGASAGIRTSLTLQETGFRFPADTEVQLHRLVQTVLDDARSTQARSVALELQLAPPYAHVRVRHDGRTGLSPGVFATSPLARAGADVTMTNDEGEFCLDVRIAPAPQPGRARVVVA